MDASHAPDAERVFEDGISRNIYGGEYGCEPDPRAELRSKQDIIGPEIPEAAKCCMAVGKKCDWFFLQYADRTIPVTRDPDRGVSLCGKG